MGQYQEYKEELDELVNVYLEYLLTEEAAGWEGDHVLGLLAEYQGDIPWGGSAGGGSNSAMIHHIRHLSRSRRHPQLSLAASLLALLTPSQLAAVLAHAYYGERPDGVGIRYKAEQVAVMLGVSAESYRCRLKRGREVMAEWWGVRKTG